MQNIAKKLLLIRPANGRFFRVNGRYLSVNGIDGMDETVLLYPCQVREETEKEITMANEKYTRKMFLNDMLTLNLTDDQRECAIKWLEALEKKSAQPRVNKTRLANEALAADVVAAMAANPDAEINAAWIRDHVAGIASAQKAVAVMNIAIESGRVVRYEEKKKAYYRLA